MMSKNITLVTILGFFLAGAATSIVPSRLKAQVSIEDALSTDLNYRGQGRAGLCYAFAEEQLLKDLTCTEDCQSNASQGKFSIFDIAKAHQAAWVAKHGEIRKNAFRDLLANGSSDVFPYGEIGISSTRRSECTLEREVFFLNRSKITNPERFILADYLINLYGKFKKSPKPILAINSTALEAAWVTLQDLAKNSNDEFEFLAQVIDYTKCPDRAPIPSFHVQSKDLSDPKEISSLIGPLQSQGKSLYVGVCAEVLRDEATGASPCGRHAVVLKGSRKNPKCIGDDCENEILVVDSAFFSKRPRNTDGSTWIPTEVVVQAIAKSGRDIIAIREKTTQSANNQQANLEHKTRMAARDQATMLAKYIRDQILASGQTDIKKNALRVLEQLSNGSQPSSDQARIFGQVLNEAINLKLDTIADLDQISVAIEQAIVTFMNANTAANIRAAQLVSGNGIVWIE